jgi:hypothetical protein
MENLFSKIWKIGLVLIVLTLVFGTAVLIAVGVLSVVTVGLTFLYAQVTGQSYEMVCHTSDFVWNMNQWGKSALVVGAVILLVVYFI